MSNTWGTKTWLFFRGTWRDHRKNILQRFTGLIPQFTSLNERVLKNSISQILHDFHNFTFLLFERSKHETIDSKSIGDFLKYRY